MRFSRTILVVFSALLASLLAVSAVPVRAGLLPVTLNAGESVDILMLSPSAPAATSLEQLSLTLAGTSGGASNWDAGDSIRIVSPSGIAIKFTFGGTGVTTISGGQGVSAVYSEGVSAALYADLTPFSTWRLDMLTGSMAVDSQFDLSAYNGTSAISAMIRARG